MSEIVLNRRELGKFGLGLATTALTACHPNRIPLIRRPDAEEVCTPDADSTLDGVKENTEKVYIQSFDRSILTEEINRTLFQECMLDGPLQRDKLNVILYTFGRDSIPYDEPVDASLSFIKQQVDEVLAVLDIPVHIAISRQRIPTSVFVDQPSNVLAMEDGVNEELQAAFYKSYSLPTYPVLVADSAARSVTYMHTQTSLLAAQSERSISTLIHELGHQLFFLEDEYHRYRPSRLMSGGHPIFFRNIREQGVQKTLEKYGSKPTIVKTTTMTCENDPVFRLEPHGAIMELNGNLPPLGNDEFMRYVQNGGHIFNSVQENMIRSRASQLIAAQQLYYNPDLPACG